MTLYSYKITYDTGFAPNPFGCTLTLATCKPGIRKTKNVGHWVAGFTSKRLGDTVGNERLIYLMKVGERLLFRDYFVDPRFQDKIPDMSRRGPEPKAGDNIYRPLFSGAIDANDFEQIKNPNHTDDSRPKDLSGIYVLIASEFYYFGRDAIVLPEYLRPKVPTRQDKAGWITDKYREEDFISFIRKNYKPGRIGLPHDWPAESGE